MTREFNLLTEPLLRATPLGALTLPGVLAALARDEIESFPALRPHQAMFWHMFLVQVGALALHRAGIAVPPKDEESWCTVLRGLTPDFADDTPWCLVVQDQTKPAFMQPPVPKGVILKNDVPTPDAVDLLITSRNHDLKQAVAIDAAPEDWVFALVALQTGEGYGGAGNQGIMRMNGGSSSRPMLTLAPRPAGGKAMTPRPGAWFCRDLRVLLEDRAANSRPVLDYPKSGGLGLVWLAPWPEGIQLRTGNLDRWFIEVCRRVRLSLGDDGAIRAVKGTSKATRIDAKMHNGVMGDPWAPVHKTAHKTFTLGDGGDFDYRKLIKLLLSGDWERPLLARPASSEDTSTPLLVVAMALARGNAKTGGFKSRIVPISGKIAYTLGQRREELYELAQAQATAVALFNEALSYALVLAAAGGDRGRIQRDTYDQTQAARAHLDRFVDGIFFEYLWRQVEAQEAGRDALKREELAFVRRLWEQTERIFAQALPVMAGSGLYAPRAKVRATRALWARVRKKYPDVLKAPSACHTTHHHDQQEEAHAL